MAIHHECQHQELLVYDLQHLLAEMYKPAIKNQHRFHQIKKKNQSRLTRDCITLDIQEKITVMT